MAISTQPPIQLTINNSANCIANVSLFNQNSPSVNARTKYSWNLTLANITCGYGSVVVNGITVNITFTPTLNGLITSLNNLGFGFFCSETVLSVTSLYVVDDINVYGSLDLCSGVVINVCYDLTSGAIPLTGAAGSTTTGTLTVTGGKVYVWAYYNAVTASSGTAIWSINSSVPPMYNLSGSFTVTPIIKTGFTTLGGQLNNGYALVDIGTYNFTLTRSALDTVPSSSVLIFIRAITADTFTPTPSLSYFVGAC